MNLNQLQWQCQQNMIAGMSGLAENLKLSQQIFVDEIKQQIETLDEKQIKTTEQIHKIIEHERTQSSSFERKLNSTENLLREEDKVRSNANTDNLEKINVELAEMTSKIIDLQVRIELIKEIK